MFALLSGCTNLNYIKSDLDRSYESILVGGKWEYQLKGEDCKSTHWVIRFYKNREYKSYGSHCDLEDAYWFDAENWYIKDGVIYITRLNYPDDEGDVISKSKIIEISRSKLVLESNDNKDTFKR